MTDEVPSRKGRTAGQGKDRVLMASTTARCRTCDDLIRPLYVDPSKWTHDSTGMRRGYSPEPHWAEPRED